MAIVDLHSHLMPGVDDGAKDLEESRAALLAFREDGVEAAVTTPHLKGSLTQMPDVLERRLDELDRAWQCVSAMVSREFPGFEFHRGVEMMLDTPDPDASDPRLRLAGGPFVLVEFPFMSVPPRSTNVLAKLCRQGWVPIVAHPESYQGLDREVNLPGEWRAAGAYLQVNSASLIGRYGPDAQRVAMQLLGRGWVDYLSSDYHARGKPRVASARRLLTELGGEEHVQLDRKSVV